MADVRGMPLLSGPAPSDDNGHEASCRKCNKEFNVLFARSRRCHHCGFSYCHSCSDYQALMPRSAGAAGYDPVNVCGYCIEYLSITAAGKGQLKGLPLARLRKYASAYSIPITGAVEKDDVIDALMAARNPNGCLAPVREQYYRTHSIPPRSGPPRGMFSRPNQTPNPNPPPVPPRPSASQNFPRPDLTPDPPPVPPRPTSQQAPPPPPRPNNNANNNTNNNGNNSFFGFSSSQRQTHTSTNHAPPPTPPRPQSNYNHAHSFPSQGPYHQPAASRSSSNIPNHNTHTSHHAHPNNTPPRPRATSSTPPAPSPPSQTQAPPPTLDELLNMSAAAIGSLTISALKSILFTNHINAGQVLEKSDLVKKVIDLLEEERRHRERHRMMEEQEEREQIERQRAMLDEIRREREAREAREGGGGDDQPAAASTSTTEDLHMNPDTATTPEEDKPRTPSPPMTTRPSSGPSPSKLPSAERSGLCVICQDDEANIAIVDCGHMAMCMSCSQLVMSSSRECPLCRTRIVTEQRLLRIFKT